jgi:PAS domain S-box-containing protein
MMTDRIRVLYAEDDPRDADLTSAHFDSKCPEFDLHVVDRGETFLKCLKKEEYDLLLIDYRLPDMGGLDLVKSVKKLGITIPVVMITAYGDEESIVQCFRCGASDYVSKHTDYLSKLPALLKRNIEEQAERNNFIKQTGLKEQYLLYVEHNAMDIELTLKHFSQHAPHINTKIVKSCQEALDLLSRREDFDVVLTDLRMPDMSALVFLKEARNLGVSLPFIVITGKGDEDTAVTALKLGAYDYIIKTDNYLDQLSHSIDHAIAHFRLIGMNQKLNEELKELNRGLERNIVMKTEELASKEKRFRTFFHDSPVGNVITDRKGKLIQTNEAFRDMLGYTEQALENLNFVELVYPNDRRETQDFLQALLDGNRSRLRCEKRLLSKGGQPIWCHIAVSGLPDGEGKSECVIGTIEDISERKNLEHQLLHSQKMEAIGRLAGGIAHDFNNILTAIIGHSDLMLLDYDTSHPNYKHIRTIHKAADRAAQLIRQLLAFSRRQVVEPVNVDLNSLIRDLEKMIPRLTGEDVHHEFVLADNLNPIKADPASIEQVLLNLVVNARDAMPEGGQLAISTAKRVLDNEFCSRHPDLSPGEYVLLTVSDTGSGISDEVKTHIFEPFFTTKSEGTGLGLSSVYGIVKQIGGHLYVTSQQDKGTCFEIYFPALPEENLEGKNGLKRSEEQLPTGSETILVVEDEPSLLKLSVNLLNRLGYTVIPAASAGEAMAMIREHRDHIDLMLTDVIMPDQTGPEVTKAIRKKLPGLKVIYMSGYAENRTGLSADLAHQKTNFLPKPFTMASIANKVRKTLDS